jgi:hypothetical protein
MNALIPAQSANTAEPITDEALTDLDARLAFLQQASARCTLVELNELPLDTAFGDLVEPFSNIVGLPQCEICGAQPCINENFCQACRLADQHLAQKRRGRR